MAIATLPREGGVHRVAQQLLSGRRLVLASNRGPLEHFENDDGVLEARRGSGGLVSALSPLADLVPLTWIATPLGENDRQVATACDGLLDFRFSSCDTQVRFVVTPKKAYNAFLNQFSNPTLWFLQHGLWNRLRPDRLGVALEKGWCSYVAVNKAIAKAVAEELRAEGPGSVAAIHDYHFYLASRFIRRMSPDAILQQFVHIPWPAVEQWRYLPAEMVRAICDGLCANDIVGFQTPSSACHFLATCTQFLPGAVIDEQLRIRWKKRETRVRVYPVSVDVEELQQKLASLPTRRALKRLRPLCREITLVRVDRLDPSKNIIRGLEAYALLLQDHLELRERIVFLAFLVPSRLQVPEYRRYKQEVITVISAINQRYGSRSWRPIELFYEHNYEQALAGMHLADVLLVNPLADGMNLVSKEGPIVNGQDGVLVLSRNAGSYEQLGEAALPVDPLNVAETADALYRAITMPLYERRERLRRLQAIIQQADSGWWLRAQFEDLLRVKSEGRISLRVG